MIIVLNHTVSKANNSSGRIVLPATWIGATVKVVLGGEIYDDYVRPGGNQGRLNVKIKYYHNEATIIRTSE